MKAASITMRFIKTDRMPAVSLDDVNRYRAIADPLVEVTVPVLNEAAVLADTIHRLDSYLTEQLPYRYRITIADNGSQDGTGKIADKLAAELSSVYSLHLKERGRGRALRTAWQHSPADILAYMDVDLSTDLNDFLPLIAPLAAGQAGLAIGSRLHRQSRTRRSFKREFISRCYNRIVRWSSGTRFSDVQCGFKAIRRDTANRLLPHINDNGWFFDTELLIKAAHAGVPVHEQPVAWTEDTDSRVKIVKTAVDDLKGLHRVNRELDHRPTPEKFALPALLVAAGALYMFGALHNDMGNSYYAAAVQAATHSWKAWLFGSLDAANYISVDKPPIATMLMGLSARIFGFSSFSMFLPDVLAGVGSVWLLYAGIKRQFGFVSAMIAAAVLALTPAAVLMFGFNNPDAILTFLLTASGYAFLRSLEGRRPLLWLGLAGLATGLAFNTKMLQGMVAVPAMGIVYLAFAKPRFVKRIGHLLAGGVAALAATLWWPVLVWLTPASQRPWIGSTDDNNIWNLIFGYNGFGRLLGKGSGQGFGGGRGLADGGLPAGGHALAAGAPSNGGTGMPGGFGDGAGGGHGPGGSGFGGSTGILRMWNGDFGPNIAWLLLFALVGGGVMLWILRKTPRNNRGRATVMFWLLWLLIHMAVFSITSGVIHPYYVVVMAPAVAALTGISLPFFWAAYRRRKPYALVLPAAVVATSLVAMILFGYAGNLTIISGMVVAAGVAGAAGLLIAWYRPAMSRIALAVGIAGSLVACLTGPAVYALSTATVSHTGSVPTAGPAGTALAGSSNESATADSSLVKYLLANQDGATWIVAVASANESAAIQLSTGQPVMAVGGFSGSDSALTLDQFKQMVASGKVRYYAVSSRGFAGGFGGRGTAVGTGAGTTAAAGESTAPTGGFGPGGTMGGMGSASNSAISEWVTSHGVKVAYGGSGVTLYRLGD